jgi:hypothetical protein
VLRYKTDLKGQVTAGALGFWMEIWIIGNRKYREILNLLKEWGGEKRTLIANHDLLVSCEVQQYQQFTMTPMKKALWKTIGDDVKAYMMEEMPKYKLSECLGETIEEDALKRRFARLARRTETAEVATTDFDEVLPGSEAGSGGGGFLDELTDDEEGTKAEVKEEAKVPDVPAAVTKEEVDDGNFLDDLLEDE